MRNQDQLRRNIEDNLNYRTTKAKVEELTREIESLEEQILNIGGIPAVEAEIVKILRERERLLSEVSRFLYNYSSHSDMICCLWLAIHLFSMMLRVRSCISLI